MRLDKLQAKLSSITLQAYNSSSHKILHNNYTIYTKKVNNYGIPVKQKKPGAKLSRCLPAESAIEGVLFLHPLDYIIA